jgi:hypothetical protein
MEQNRKDFIIEAHDNACNDWRNRIEKEFPKLFKKDDLEVGKWYNGYEDYLLFITKIKQEIGYKKIYYYGFTSGYVDEDYIANTDIEKYLKPATNKEVEQALIKEAKKRGFKEGVKFNSAWRSGAICYFNGMHYEAKNNSLSSGCSHNDCIFQSGKWAEIVKETITKEQAEKELGKTILN